MRGPKIVNVHLLVDSGGYRLPVPRRTLCTLVQAVARGEGYRGPVSVGLTVTDEDTIRGINLRYRGVDAPTDVLSFSTRPEAGERFVPPPDGILHLGDIVICYPRVIQQAQDYGHSRAREFCYLFVHGLLHIFGYDHEDPTGQRRMRQREEAVLVQSGLTRAGRGGWRKA
jgi:probable rRNA maturation factor